MRIVERLASAKLAPEMQCDEWWSAIQWIRQYILKPVDKIKAILKADCRLIYPVWIFPPPYPPWDLKPFLIYISNTSSNSNEFRPNFPDFLFEFLKRNAYKHIVYVKVNWKDIDSVAPFLTVTAGAVGARAPVYHLAYFKISLHIAHLSHHRRETVWKMEVTWCMTMRRYYWFYGWKGKRSNPAINVTEVRVEFVLSRGSS